MFIRNEKKMNIEQLTNEALEILCHLIEIPRTSRNERNASDYLEQIMREKFKLNVRREKNNLWCIAEGYREKCPTLLLNAHIDTVKPVSSWKRDPFKSTREGERIYGLGSNDDGASLVSLLQVFRVLSSKETPYNLILLISAEEEVSGHDGIEHVLPLLPPIDMALVGEPTGMQPAIAEKGLMVLDVTSHGKSGHAASDKGDNAIYHAIDDIQWFRTHKWAKESELLGPVKMSVTIIQAGSQHNVVPDTCTFTVDVRSNELYHNEELYHLICQQVKSEVKARSFRLNSSSIPITHPLVQRAIKLGKTPFGSPTLSDQALMAIPSLKMGPGQSSRSHTADEFIEVGEVKDAIETYVKMLEKM